MSPPLTPTARYVAVIQFVFLCCWTVYVVYLPSLLEGVGIAREVTVWLLLADQVLFAVFDVAAGFAADRARRVYARIGPWLVGATMLSCTCFAALPWLSGSDDATWQAPLLLALTAVWAITSSALRAPVFAMITRHAARPAVPRLAAIMLMGTALASAVAPYLGTVLNGLDPRLPFALSSIALVALSAGLMRAERHATSDTEPAREAPPLLRFRLPTLLGLIMLAALGFQADANLNAGPRYLLDAPADTLPWLMPIFWIGFHLALTQAGRVTRAAGSTATLAIGCVFGALGATLTALAPGLTAAAAAQLIAGLGWGLALSAVFGLIGEFGRARNQHGGLTGILFAILALATFVRLGLSASGLARDAGWMPWILAFPVLAWLTVAVFAGLAARRTAPA